MTSLIDNNIDELIRRVREYPVVSDVVFMTAFPPRELPNPINKYVAAVVDRGVRTSQEFIGGAVGEGMKGRLYHVELVLRVYAPRDTGASALLRMTSLLCDTLERADTDGAIGEISLGRIVYQKTARTVYRDVRVSLEWLLCREESV